MIVRMTEAMKVSDRWFLIDDEYLLFEEVWLPASSCEQNCRPDLQQLSNPYFRIIVDTRIYDIPQYAAAVFEGDVPRVNKGGRIKRMIREFYTKDVTARLFGGHTDVVKSAKMFMGIDIAQKKAFNADVNQYAIRELREIQRSRNNSSLPPDVSVPKEKEESGSELLDPDTETHNQ